MSVQYEMTPVIYHLEARNKAAEAVITAFATEHALIDAFSGLAAGLIPGGSLVALAGQLAYSAARVYPAMIKKLTVIYASDEDEFTRMVMRNAVVIETGIEALVAAAGPDILTQVGVDLTAEFGSDFLQEVVGEILGEAALATGASFIPIVGAIFGATLDAIVAATLTWRVGATVAAYFQGGGYIDSRKKTYDAIKQLVPKSLKTSRPGTLNQIWKRLEPVKNKQIAQVRKVFKQKGQVRAKLISDHGVPSDIVDAAIARIPLCFTGADGCRRRRQMGFCPWFVWAGDEGGAAVGPSGRGSTAPGFLFCSAGRVPAEQMGYRMALISSYGRAHSGTRDSQIDQLRAAPGESAPPRGPIAAVPALRLPVAACSTDWPATLTSSRCSASLNPCTHATTRSPARCSFTSPRTHWTGAGPAGPSHCP